MDPNTGVLYFFELFDFNYDYNVGYMSNEEYEHALKGTEICYSISAPMSFFFPNHKPTGNLDKLLEFLESELGIHQIFIDDAEEIGKFLVSISVTLLENK